MKDHDSGAREQAEEGGVAGATGPNVVPFPRSWYGAADELVPIRAADPPRRPAPTADASTFWGGESTAPDATAEGMAGADGSGSTQRPPHAEPRDAEPAPVWSSLRVGAGIDPGRPAPRAPVSGALNDGRRAGRRLRPALLALVVCVALLVAVVASFAPGTGGGQGEVSHGADKLAKLAATSATRAPGPAAAGTTGRPTRNTSRHGNHATARRAPGRRAMASRPAVTTQQGTGSTPVPAEVSPTGGGTPVTTAPASASSGSGPDSKTGGVGAPAGALPDIQQTNQQP